MAKPAATRDPKGKKVIMDINPQNLGKVDTIFMDFLTLYGNCSIKGKSNKASVGRAKSTQKN